MIAGRTGSQIYRIMVWWKLMRPFTLLPPLLGMWSGAASAWGAGHARHMTGVELLCALLLGGLMAALLNGASNALNQVYDLSLDRINKPHRPIPSGNVSVAGALRFAVVLYAMSVVITWFIQPAGRPELTVIVLLTAVLTWAYSAPPIRARNSWWLAPLVIAIPRGGLLKVAGWATLAGVSTDPEPWALGGVFFLFVLGVAGVKDFTDMDGDRQGGATSLPLRFGPQRAARMMAPFLVFPWILLALLSLGVGGEGPVLKVSTTPALVLCALLVAHGTFTAWKLISYGNQMEASDRGVQLWRNVYLLMMEAQIGVALLYLFFGEGAP